MLMLFCSLSIYQYFSTFFTRRISLCVIYYLSRQTFFCFLSYRGTFSPYSIQERIKRPRSALDRSWAVSRWLHSHGLHQPLISSWQRSDSGLTHLLHTLPYISMGFHGAQFNFPVPRFFIHTLPHISMVFHGKH